MKAHPILQALILTALLLPQGCSDDEDAPAPEEGVPARRTVLIYMAAQNSLGSRGYLDDDLSEILSGRGNIPDADRLLVFVDDGSPRIYRYVRQESSPRTVRTWTSDVCSTSPATLRDVLEWTRAHYPADEYGLVMWSHASGWVPATDKNYPTAIRPFSFGIDTGENAAESDDGPEMDVDDMADAIAAAGVHLKYVFFDACLMQNLETGWALRNVTDYVVASPIATPAAGSNYTHQLQNGLFSSNPADIAATYYADVTDPAQVADYGDFGIVISAIQTDRLQPVATALQAALPQSSLSGHASPDMENVLNYQAYTSIYFYRPHNYDARQALRHILPEGQREAALQALENAVVYKAATARFYIGPYNQRKTVDLTDYAGVSLFVPQQTYSDHAALTKLGDLNAAFRDTEWYTAAGWEATGW